MTEARPEHPFKEAHEIFRAEIESELSERGPVIARALDALAGSGCRADLFFDRLFLDELISNAIIHGNRRDPKKRVTVRAFRDGDRWGFEITDEGRGFDWAAVIRDTKNAAGSLASSGRGLALIRASGAELRFLDGGRQVVVVRREGTDGAGT